jgi:hypothetical protein
LHAPLINCIEEAFPALHARPKQAPESIILNNSAVEQPTPMCEYVLSLPYAPVLYVDIMIID